MTSLQASIFHNRQPDADKLKAYGFTKQAGAWHYTQELVPGFELQVTIKGDTITTPVIDRESGLPYVLHLDLANSGMFVGQVRGAYVAALKAIAAKCFTPTMFAGGQMQQVLAAVADQYSDQPEYLWAKFPNNAILRRQDNRKWYALLVKVSADKVGLAGSDLVDLLVLRADPATIQAQLAAGTALPAYHMNKQHWLSYRLDNGLKLTDLMAAVATSRSLAH